MRLFHRLKEFPSVPAAQSKFTAFVEICWIIEVFGNGKFLRQTKVAHPPSPPVWFGPVENGPLDFWFWIEA